MFKAKSKPRLHRACVDQAICLNAIVDIRKVSSKSEERSGKFDEEEEDGKTASEVKTELARLSAEITRLKQKATTKPPHTEHSNTAEGEAQTEMNSLGEHCPVERGTGRCKEYMFFVDKQYCAVCKKETHHLPRYCPEIPREKKRKAS